ncbi:MAG: NYN domain-containing protein [Halocynthiibacter sp.]
MPFLLLVFVLSGATIGASFILDGLNDALLIAVPLALASLFLLLKNRRRKPTDDTDTDWVPDPDATYVVLDGSNVMYWDDNTPKAETLRAVINALLKRGIIPGVIFDANAGYLLTGSYQHHKAMSQLVGLPAERVMVVGKGVIADEVILQAARDNGWRIVTNDKYRDWRTQFPELRKAGHLISGRVDNGTVKLNFKQSRKPRSKR